MDATRSQIFFPATLPELFAIWKREKDAVPFAGGLSFMRGQYQHTLSLPPHILSLEKLEELRRVSRTERYLEFGAMTGLNEILNLGKSVPEALRLAIGGIANPRVRAIATIGGNVCYPRGLGNAAAPLIALEARYELRSESQSRWLSASRFSQPGDPPAQWPAAIGPGELLTRIRIPLEQWDYSVYRKFGTEEQAASGGAAPGSGVAIFLARMLKNTLTDMRLVCAGETVLRDKNSETVLTGKSLPLERRDALHYVERWETYLEGTGARDGIPGRKLLNFIEETILALAD
jgi:CO/xanthine dehydrogenase FAD-binding subunit